MAMRENRIRRLLKEGKATVNTRIWSTWGTTAEAAAASGSFDYLEFLAEYAPFTLPELENFVRACELHDCGSMIKVDYQNRFYVAQKAIAMGFQAVLFTDHQTPEQVRETLCAVTPEAPQYGGRFGYPNARWLGYNPEPSQMEYAAMNASSVKAFMIEKKEAVDHIEEICSVPGVDMVQFGPSDYCMSLGWNSSEHKTDWKAAEKHVIETALAHGVQPRVELYDPADAEEYIQMGVRHFCIGDEFDILKDYWSNVGGKMKNMVK
ncbi:MAG: 2,4-dihydroxyhept-2-ene-1,7-dioic acid aldolase [Lachnospiraceae bacterium]|nr:2,4-dihydroxyhept-2-ene-1,7-dioic acid aldolase [Lachnospiraceae bacterium]